MAVQRRLPLMFLVLALPLAFHILAACTAFVAGGLPQGRAGVVGVSAAAAHGQRSPHASAPQGLLRAGPGVALCACLLGAAGLRRRRSGCSMRAGDEDGASKINTKIDLESPKVVTMEDLAPGEKKVYCRCWLSKTFPLCDGAHAKHNKETGDNVGPLIVKAKE
mmetsp:Transcript_109000/g.307217  ORF Transcript_109000/g.307217 Transcript_109000/m.307217 type:complete len:164 (+) Transcript_109000:93-584(+)|eukprot:CAMPEP_0117536990 /NCGR_PEP_ID=MMETSP0784-20121206/41734_1 /TAXON_ID=39447 /ORGANISM="" /LENGTH=163 /DNA_ID=CAMNT_0005333563 /DNA_START=82 /DNA_END=573 /DNA_ORIENTATION=-